MGSSSISFRFLMLAMNTISSIHYFKWKLECKAKVSLVEDTDVCLDVHIEAQVLHTGHLSPTGVYFEIHVLVKY